MLPAVRFLVTGKADIQSAAVAERAENRRTQIADSYNDGIEVWYSPKPGSADGQDKLEPGRIMQFSAERVAATGKDRRWGTAMYLIAREFQCTSGIELGTCAGISAMYIASVPSIKRYVTVEGSPALAAIARDTLADFPSVEVVNAPFEDALELDLKVDFAFVDGHHEQQATIHYAKRLRPKLAEQAIVIFDDISWSADMRAAWDQLRTWSHWSHAIDLGAIGVCIADSDQTPPRQWDLQPIVGRVRISTPWGWNTT